MIPNFAPVFANHGAFFTFSVVYFVCWLASHFDANQKPPGFPGKDSP